MPSPWAQALPRSVRLSPGGLFVPAGTLRTLLGRGSPLDLLVTGHALAPFIGDGATVTVEPGRKFLPGDVVLCEAGGWGDLRRVLRILPDGAAVTGLDAWPGARETVAPEGILGTLRRRRGAGDARGRLAARLFPVWSRLAALLHGIRRVRLAPDFGAAAGDSVRGKYDQQVDGYAGARFSNVEPWLLQILGSRIPPPGSILVGGSGAGSEALQLARAGYRICGVDFVPRMVDRARATSAAARIEAEYLVADLVALDLKPRVFDAAYLTPSVYSFIAGRGTRVATLARLGRHLAPGGIAIWSVQLRRGARRRLQAALLFILRRLRGASGEYGDWYTSFLTPGGALGASFVHLARPGAVLREARRAGFQRVVRARGGHFIASEFEAHGG